MYVHPAFKIHHAVGLAFAAARGFGHVIACEGGRPVAALLPFHVMEANGRLPRVQFHVARPNPLAHLATKGGPWLVAVAGDDAYVSPRWYASAEQVPTWLYDSSAGPCMLSRPPTRPTISIVLWRNSNRRWRRSRPGSLTSCCRRNVARR